MAGPWRLAATSLLILGSILVGSPLLAAAPKGPLQILIEPSKRIYSSREGLMVKVVFKARERVKLCLEKDILSQMQWSVTKYGTGKLAVAPLVMRDNSELFNQRVKILWLEPGESTMFRINLKRLKFTGGESWDAAEYSVTTSFNLCEQTPGEEYNPGGKEIPIQAENSGWLMIMK